MAKTDPKKAAAAAKDKLKNSAAGKAISGVFDKIGKHTGATNKKVDEWQKKWLAMPKNRTKVEGLKDAPKAAGEEVFAMANDIINFVQREEGGQSHVFKKLKEEGGDLIKNPKGYVKQKVEAGKKKAAEAKKAADKAKGAAKKGGKGGGAHKKLDEIIEKAKKGIAEAKERAKKGIAEAKKRAEEAKKKAGAATKKVKK